MGRQTFGELNRVLHSPFRLGAMWSQVLKYVGAGLLALVAIAVAVFALVERPAVAPTKSVEFEIPNPFDGIFNRMSTGE